MDLSHKLVAVLNKDIESGVAMNALAHMSLGLGSHVPAELLRLDTYIDKDQNVYPNISQIPFIILRAKSGEIRKTVYKAREMNLSYGAFVNTMTTGTYIQQLSDTRNTHEEELKFYGCVLFGPWEQVTEITKKFSLWKS